MCKHSSLYLFNAMQCTRQDDSPALNPHHHVCSCHSGSHKTKMSLFANPHAHHVNGSLLSRIDLASDKKKGELPNGNREEDHQQHQHRMLRPETQASSASLHRKMCTVQHEMCLGQLLVPKVECSKIPKDSFLGLPGCLP